MFASASAGTSEWPPSLGNPPKGRWLQIPRHATTAALPRSLLRPCANDQSRVVSLSGLDFASSCLVQINRNYVFQGGSIDIQQIFRID
jgi:hypothetical protein